MEKKNASWVSEQERSQWVSLTKGSLFIIPLLSVDSQTLLFMSSLLFHQCRRKLVIQSNPQRALCGKTDSQVKYLSHTITRKRTYGTCDVDLTCKRMKKRLRDYKTTTTTTTNKQTNRHTHMNSKFIDSNMYLPPIRQSELRLAHLSRKWTLPQCASNN